MSNFKPFFSSKSRFKVNMSEVFWSGRNMPQTPEIVCQLSQQATTLRAYIDGTPTTFTSESQDGAWLITFNYSHSQHTITLQIGDTAAPTGGFGTLQLVAVALVAAVTVVAVAAVLMKRKKNLACPPPPLSSTNQSA